MFTILKLSDEHGCKVLVSYNIHDLSKIIVKRMNSTYLYETM
ncbi:MAG: Mu transposase C-terminal domain-containing protein [Arsenophonus sp. NEOnobi-MAG3]